MRKKRKSHIYRILTALLMLGCTAVPVCAAETPETLADDTSGPGDDELTQTFYMPKSMFRTDIDYQDYCERMYKYGYMDKNYNWSSAAQNFIVNQTLENAEKAEQAAQAAVQERIDNGELEEEDNPYLTYDERQKILAKKEAQKNEQSTGDGSKPDYVPDETETEDNIRPWETEYKEENPWPEGETQMESETEQAEETKTAAIGKLISYVIIVLFLGAAALMGYWIYKRQF